MHIASSLVRVETQADGLEEQNSRRRAAPNSRHLILAIPRGARTAKVTADTLAKRALRGYIRAAQELDRGYSFIVIGTK